MRTHGHASPDTGILVVTLTHKPTNKQACTQTSYKRCQKCADMAGNWDPLYETAIDCLERVTVRNSVVHGHSTLRPDLTLPLVCIGDSPQNCGLGGGGVLAMQDAIELSKVLLSEGAFTTAARGCPLRTRRLFLPILHLVQLSLASGL